MENQPRVLLVGDVCVDEYYYVHQIRVNPEFPTAPLYTVKQVVRKQGMAANVANCLQMLNVDVVTCLPVDNLSKKTRIIDDKTKNQLSRIDLDMETPSLDLNRIDFSGFDIVVISDYNKSFIREETILGIKSKFKNGPIFLDTKKPDLAKFRGCVVKINMQEARDATSFPPDDNLIITKGDKGAAWKNQVYRPLTIRPVDPCGAGDAFLAGLVYGYLKDKILSNAIEYGIVNSGISVEHSGVYAPTEEQLTDRIKIYRDQLGM